MPDAHAHTHAPVDLRWSDPDRSIGRRIFLAPVFAYRAANPNATNAQALQSICETPVSVTTQPFDTRRSTNGSAEAVATGGSASNTAIPGCTVGAQS